MTQPLLHLRRGERASVWCTSSTITVNLTKKMRAKKASPEGKLAPKATEGECESLGLNCYTQTDNRTV